MSLINQVLQDLDRRQAVAAGVPTSVRHFAAPAASMNRAQWKNATVSALVLAILAAVGMAWPGRTSRFATTARTALPMQAATATVATPTVATPTDTPATVARLSSLPATDAGRAPAAGAPPPATRIDVDRERTPAPMATPTQSPGARDDERRMPIAASAAPLEVATRAAPAVAPPSVELRPRPLSAGERAEAEYQRGLGMHQRGQDSDAETAFAAALKEDHGHVAARQALAITWIGRRRLDDARRLIIDGLEVDARDLSLSILLARVRIEQMDSSGAMETLRSALETAPASTRRTEQADARALLATLQQRAGRHSEAIDNYAAALRLLPNNGAWWVGLAVSLSAEGRTETAQHAFERARATETLSPDLALYVEQRLRSLPFR